MEEQGSRCLRRGGSIEERGNNWEIKERVGATRSNKENKEIKENKENKEIKEL